MPVGSALLATALAVIALCGTAVFGASLSHLTATPTLYGDPFQLNISDPNSGGTPDPVLLKSLEHDRAVTGISQGIALPAISINKVVVGAIAGRAIRGPLLLLDGGRLPPHCHWRGRPRRDDDASGGRSSRLDRPRHIIVGLRR